MNNEHCSCKQRLALATFERKRLTAVSQRDFFLSELMCDSSIPSMWIVELNQVTQGGGGGGGGTYRTDHTGL